MVVRQLIEIFGGQPGRLPGELIAATSSEAATAAWDELTATAVAHGVAAGLWKQLQGTPVESIIERRLAGIYLSNVARNQRLRTEEDAVLAALAAAGLRAWPLKGTRLAEDLYGDAGVRQCSDIDLLIDPRELAAVDTALQRCGFALDLPVPVAQLAGCGEMGYSNSAGAHLDLHQRLVPYGRRDPLAERLRREGMRPELLLVYLCVNCVTHRFSRLKYFLDIRQAARRLDATQWSRVPSLAQELDLWPGIGHALRLTHELAPDGILPSVLESLRMGPLARWGMGRGAGANLEATLQRGAALEGPYGALVILWATAGGRRPRRLMQLLFPSAATMRMEDPAGKGGRALQLWLRRFARKSMRATQAAAVPDPKSKT